MAKSSVGYHLIVFLAVILILGLLFGFREGFVATTLMPPLKPRKGPGAPCAFNWECVNQFCGNKKCN